MRLEDLLADGAAYLDEMEKMSDQQLHELCKQWFPTTRPELANPAGGRKQRSDSNNASIPVQQLSPEKKKMMQALAAAGVDTSFLKHRFKR